MARRDQLSDAQIEAALGELSGWTRDGDQIVRSFEFGDFGEAFGFLARTALLQEQADHHAEYSGVYNRLRLALSTHDAGGITQMDIDLAREIDALESIASSVSVEELRNAGSVTGRSRAGHPR